MNTFMIVLMFFFAIIAAAAAFLELRSSGNERKRRGAHFIYGVQSATGLLGTVITVFEQNRYAKGEDISDERGAWILSLFNGYFVCAVIFTLAVVLVGILAAASGSKLLKIRIAVSFGGQLLLIFSAYLYSVISAGDNSAVSLCIRAVGISLSQVIAIRGLSETALVSSKTK